MEFRIGQGLDVHRLVSGRKLIIGGVVIPYERGLLGHSDADVLTHAIIDSLLGATGKADIGTYFPSEDPQWKDADSINLLKQVWQMIKKEGWEIQNVDCTLSLEEPKMKPHIQAIRQRLSETLEIKIECCAVKAGTMEGLGFVGKGEGVMAQAIVLLMRGQ